MEIKESNNLYISCFSNRKKLNSQQPQKGGHMDKKWEDEITYEANLGIILKKKIRISPAGIEWEGQLWTLDSITRIGFCIFSHSVNYIPVGTNYTVSFGTRSKRLSIDLRKKNIYLNFKLNYF